MHERFDESEDNYVATECICDDNGVHYICPICNKAYKSDLDAIMCCLPDETNDVGESKGDLHG